MTAVNPGPATTSTPNSMIESIVTAGTTVAYTFATLPAPGQFLPGFIALTSDQGLCYVTTAKVWAVLGVPQSGGAIPRQITNLPGLTNLTAPGQGSVSIEYWDQLW